MTGTRARRAFTLTETLIVVLLLGILSSVAVPAYWKIRDQVTQSSDKGSLRQLALLQRANFTNVGRFDVSGADLAARGDVFTLVAGEPAAGEVSIAVSTIAGHPVLGLAARTAAGTCLTMRVFAPRTPKTASTLDSTGETTSGSCTGTAALSVDGEAW